MIVDCYRCGSCHLMSLFKVLVGAVWECVCLRHLYLGTDKNLSGGDSHGSGGNEFAVHES